MKSAHRIGLGWLAVLLVPAAALAETIDFQTPVVGGTSQVEPYIAAGVTFEALPAGFAFAALYVETSDPGCTDATNQLLGCMGSWNPPGYSGSMALRAVFPPAPAEPVTSVSVEVAPAAPDGSIALALDLYSAADIAVGGAVAQPVGGGCVLGSRVLLTATASEPVAYAVISGWYTINVECGEGLGNCSAVSVWIDNFTYGASPVSVETATWGRVKAGYR